MTVTIPPFGSRLVHIEGEFLEVTSQLQNKSLQGYIRLATKSIASIGVQIITKEVGANDQTSFCTLV